MVYKKIMKQKTVIIFMIFINYYAFSQNDKISFQFGNIGFGYNIRENENFEIDISILNYFFEFPGFGENPKARVGIECYPFDLKILPVEQNAKISFFNLNFFTDFLGPVGNGRWDYIRFGPFFALKWLTIEKVNFDFHNYDFSTGLRFTLLGYTETILRFQFMDFELGYRITQSNNSFYFLIKFDFIDVIIFPMIPFTKNGFFDRLFAE
jgi:hypothetical protein